jgi:hypothetical protein
MRMANGEWRTASNDKRWVGYSLAIAVLVPFALFFLYAMYGAFYGLLRLPNWAVPPLLWHLPGTGGYIDACPGPR